MAGPGRWLTRILLGLVGVIVLALAAIYVMSERYLARTYPVREVAITLPSDSASLARGERLARLSCYGCHGETLTGTVMFEAPLVARLVTPNALIAISEYSDAQLAGLLRYGVRTDGTSPMTMPPIGMYHMSDADLASLIAYLRTVPKQPSAPLPSTSYGPLGRLGMLAGQFPTTVNLIDTTVARVGADTAVLGSRQGEYLARMICTDCHGAGLTGGVNGPAPSPSLSGALGYSPTEFLALLHEGKPREAGKAIPNMSEVATHTLKYLTDDEVRAIHAYLLTVPATGVPMR